MQELLRSTNAYSFIRADAKKGSSAHTVLVVFPDEKYLRPLLKECAKAFFGAEEGSREARLISEEHYSDCHIYPEAGGKLTADLVGEIVDESLLRPVEGAKKLFVLDGFHTATPLIQNKLLKLLEEPPAGVYFLLGAANAFSVLPTVRSRAKTVTVPPFPEEQIARALQRLHGDGGSVAEAAAACGGVYSVAEELLEGGGEDFRLAERFLSLTDAEVLCREISERKEKRAFFAAVRLVLRDILFYATGQEQFAARRSAEVKRLAGEYPAGAALAGLKFVEQAEREIGFNANFSQCALNVAICLKKEKEKWQKLS